MRIIHALLWGFIITWFSLPVYAELQISLQSAEFGMPAKVIVSNDVIVPNVDVYLVYFDLDAEAERQFLSWQLHSGQWESGLKPLSRQPLNLPVLESYSIEVANKSFCSANHRCFLATVATSPNHTATEFWQASAFLPLNRAAACERFPGQQHFLYCDGSAFRKDDLNQPVPPPQKASIPYDKLVASHVSGIKKPDIFKLVDNNKLLVANTQAKRFQIIDVADFENPRLHGEADLTVSPQEIYVLNDHYILLQTNYKNNWGAGSINLTVFSEDEFGHPNSVHSMALPAGVLLKSWQRGELIYTVSEQSCKYCEVCDCASSVSTVNISALGLDATGKLQEVDKIRLTNYFPMIAISANFMVIASYKEFNWQSNQIQLFDLSQVDDPLLALPPFDIPGQVTSEFHLSVHNQQLRVIYASKIQEDGRILPPEEGSTLAIYDLTMPQMPLLGKVTQIAPGKDLFATRFVDNHAFVIPYDRTPLWIIDLSKPTQPTIVNQLPIPGWSEKMFFHEDRLFAVGIDEQLSENEQEDWVQRVAVSLFNVTDISQPELINRFTPLVGETHYSQSLALDDESALLLDWDAALAILPINSIKQKFSWKTHFGSHLLQIVSFAHDRIEDAGLLRSPVQIQRSLSLASDVLAVLGEQRLMTLRWGGVEPELLGELELATNLTWLQLQEDKLWAAAHSDNGFHHLYRYTLDDIEIPAERWRLPKSYAGLQIEKNLAVFYDYNPLTVQVVDINSGQLRPIQPLETSQSDSQSSDKLAPNGFNRNHPLVHNGWFYMHELQPFQAKDNHLPPQWILRSWDLNAVVIKEAQTRQIPGQPLGFTANGELITHEYSRKYPLKIFNQEMQYRLNLLALADNGAILRQTRVIPCQVTSEFIFGNNATYVGCKDDNALATQILQLDPEQGFIEVRSWTLPGYQILKMVSGETALVEPTVEIGCKVYQLDAEQDAKFRYDTLERCVWPRNRWKLIPNGGWALAAKKAWIAKGFEGIEEIEW